jgi:hypothetical protein
LLARHAEAAGDADRALVWWREAGEVATGRAAFAEAEAHLDAAEALLPALADEGFRRREQAAIAVARATASLVRRGHGHNATRALFERASVLAKEADDPRSLLTTSYGVWAFHHVRENVGHALRLAQEMVDVAARRESSDLSTVAHRSLGISQGMAGNLEAARTSLERSIESRGVGISAALRVSMGFDQGESAKSYLAMFELSSGFPDRAHARLAEASAATAPDEEVLATVFRLMHAGVCAADARASGHAGSFGADLITLATANDLQFWEALGRAILGWSLIETGDAIAAKNQLALALEIMDITGGGILAVLTRSLMIEAQAMVGNTAALAWAEEAEAIARRTGVHYGLAEIQRRRARALCLLRPDAPVEAAIAYRAAIATARAQGARFWELRAARDLARLLAEDGERRQALDLLAPIHAWFSEGFRTPDLIEAKALLEELG